MMSGYYVTNSTSFIQRATGPSSMWTIGIQDSARPVEEQEGQCCVHTLLQQDHTILQINVSGASFLIKDIILKFKSLLSQVTGLAEKKGWGK